MTQKRNAWEVIALHAEALRLAEHFTTLEIRERERRHVNAAAWAGIADSYRTRARTLEWAHT